MTPETASVPKIYTESEKGFQQLFNVGPHAKDGEVKGIAVKRLGANAGMLAAGTAADLLETEVVHRVMHHAVEPALKKISGEQTTINEYVLKHASEHLKDWQVEEAHKTFVENAKKTRNAVVLGSEFIEEWGSDTLFGSLANSWIRYLTGVEDAHYVTESSAFLADWTNTIAQVFMMKQREGLPTWKKSENWLNPVNVEAAFRMVEELPLGVGKAFAALRQKANHALEHSPVVRTANTAAAKGILGFHIGKNVMA